MSKKICFEYTNASPDKQRRFHALDLGAVSSLDYNPTSNEMWVEYYGSHVPDKFHGVGGDVWNRILDLYMKCEWPMTFCELRESAEPEINPV